MCKPWRQTTFKDYYLATRTSKIFKAVLQLYVDTEPQIFDVGCVRVVQEDLEIELFSRDELIRRSNVQSHEIRENIVLEHLNLEHYLFISNILFVLAKRFIPEEDC